METLAFSRNGTGRGVIDGVTVERHRPLFVLGNTPLRPGFSREVGRVLSRRRPDVVVAHAPVPFPAEMAYLAAHRAGVPFVTTYHAGRLRGSSPSLEAMARLDEATLQRRMLSGSRRLISVSRYVRDHALARHRRRVDIVPPGVDSHLYSPAGAPRRGRILFVGPVARSYRWKGLDVLWSAFEELSRTVPAAELRIVGEGDRFDEFSRRAREARGAVTLQRRVPEAELVEEYRRAAVVALPSTTDAESFGMVLAEANACGRPVVASRVGGVPDFVRHGHNGLLVPPGDPGALAQALGRILADEALARRLGKNGRRLVVMRHRWDDLARRTEGVLERAASL